MQFIHVMTKLNVSHYKSVCLYKTDFKLKAFLNLLF